MSNWSIDPDFDGLEIDTDDLYPSIPLKKVPAGDVFEASRAGDIDRLRYLLDGSVNVNARDKWDSTALYYACLAGHFEAARMLLEAGAICSEHTFDGDRCHYAALNLRVRRLLKMFEARPPPLGPLQAALRDSFLSCPTNRRAYMEQFDDVSAAAFSLRAAGQVSVNEVIFPPDITFYVDGRPIEAHRVILCARSPFFKKKFEMDWKGRNEVRFSSQKLSYSALYSLIHFFYSDRLEVLVDDMEDLAHTCKVCKCEELQKILQNELIHQKYAEYKSLKEVDNSQKRFILQGLSLPEGDRLPSALHQILQTSLAMSCKHTQDDGNDGDMLIGQYNDDFADVCIKVEKKIFRCHQVILASRSEYFKARLSRMSDFLQNSGVLSSSSLPFLEEHELSVEVFEKMIEYMYTDSLKDVDPDQAEEMFDAASRYLLFSLKRAVADALLPHLEILSLSELCQWVILSDMYGVTKIREYCLDMMACNFETFAGTREFSAMLLKLPPPSGDSSLRTTHPSAPGSSSLSDQGNLLDDLREKWLEAEGDELDKRDESAMQFDKRLEMLMYLAKHEMHEVHNDFVEVHNLQ